MNAPKYRGKIRVGEVGFVADAVRGTCAEMGMKSIDIAVNADHVHRFFRYPPRYSVSGDNKCYTGIVDRMGFWGGFGIKTAACPVKHIYMLRIGLDPESLPKIHITTDSAAVFRRTGAPLEVLDLPAFPDGASKPGGDLAN